MLANAGRLGKGPKGDRYALIGGRSIPSSRDRLQGRLSHEAAILSTLQREKPRRVLYTELAVYGVGYCCVVVVFYLRKRTGP